MSKFEVSSTNRVRRVPERGQYERETIYGIVDSALYCHVALVQEGRPFVIPTLHARRDDEILLHGANSSRLIRHIAEGHPVSIAVTHVDAIVLARSVFHHSINYRSVVLFGRGYRVEGAEATLDALEAFTERLLPGRWADARPPNRQELRATAVVAVPIETASAKVRSGPPGDDEADYELDHWAGLLPIVRDYGLPEADPRLSEDIVLPDYLIDFLKGRSS